MSFERKIIPLNIDPEDGDIYTQAFLIPDGSSKITAQFDYALSSDATLSIEQSTDGSNFDPVLDINGDAVTLVLNKDLTSATINLVNLLTLNLRFAIAFTAQSTGSINSVIILSN